MMTTSHSNDVEGTISVFAHYRRAGQTAEEGVGQQKIAVKTFKSAHATVGVRLGKKIYQGQYNTTELSVSVSLPCYPEEVDAGLLEAERIARTHIGRLLGRLEGKG